MPVRKKSMYLKSIEIQGFKSFYNKIKLDFSKGFTAIVGPNGSGKSNVADAVRWVLGEQSAKQLRGGSMQDVIFAGTQLRKPLSSAYVALTFDNTDHFFDVDAEEVTVGRRLYRSGESEYLLNRSQVRLRDVQELFYDTGIGKEGYSIIGQGQIEKILSEKPEDRRELFDEAAGIVKYKRRKAESQKKLESEEANLVRVNDILSELEKQLATLEKQSQKARTYLDDREELKKLEVRLFLLSNETANQKIEQLAQEYDAAKAQLQETEQKQEQVRRTWEKAKDDLSHLEKSIEEERNDVAHSNIVRSHLEMKIQVGKETIRSLDSSIASYQSRQESIEKQTKEKERQKEELKNGKTGVDDIVKMLEKFRSQSQGDLKAVQNKEAILQTKMEAQRSLLMETIKDRGSIKAKQASLAAQRTQIEERGEKLSGELESALAQKQQQGDELNELHARFDTVTKQVQDLTNEKTKIEKEIDEQKKNLSLADERLQKAQGQYHQEKSRLDTLKNITERYEGFGISVKRVMEEKKNEKGIIGVVADIIKTDSRYEIAVETALGGSIQNIVTDNEATARRMIELLKKEKAGRATFLPLNSIHPSQNFNMMGALKEQGSIGLAHTLVKTAPEHREIAVLLLGRTLVVDTYDHAVAIARKYQQKIRIVTLGGELFSPGGSISGGAFHSNSNLLGRRREIQELEKSITRLSEEQIASQNSIVKAKQTRNTLREKLEENRTNLQNAYIEQNTLRVSIETKEKEQNEVSQDHQELIEENASLAKTKETLEKEENEIATMLAQSKQKEEEVNSVIDTLNAEDVELRKKEEEKQSDLQKWDVEIQKNEQKQQFEEQELERLSEELEKLKNEKEEMISGIQDAGTAKEEKEKEIQSLRESISSSKVEEQEKKTMLEENLTQKTKLSSKIDHLLEEREEYTEEKSRMDQEVYRLGEKKKKEEEALEGKINHLWEEYEITPQQAKEIARDNQEDLNESTMKNRCEELKKEIHSLGDVHVGAIEEYNDVKERYTFLQGQQEDLTKASASLKKIIEDLDVQMRKQFKTQFARIQEEFNDSFRQLFGGGEAKLELAQGEDVLDAGVYVIAQPPGKKLQNMMQMSGGEKALTAIALLFAIQNLKPSPFCLLDEIEAALDESNVVRYAEYLKRLSLHTQFIVITHRRGTMERADRLYGITMQEKGVSSLVSVSLISDELTA